MVKGVLHIKNTKKKSTKKENTKLSKADRKFVKKGKACKTNKDLKKLSKKFDQLPFAKKSEFKSNVKNMLKVLNSGSGSTVKSERKVIEKNAPTLTKKELITPEADTTTESLNPVIPNIDIEKREKIEIPEEMKGMEY